MKIAIASDLHLESGVWQRIDLPDAEVLILAGDIFTTRSASNADEFLSRCNEKYEHVIFIMGNHEFYKCNYHDAKDKIALKLSEYPSFIFLDDTFVDLGGFRFIGSTLWSYIFEDQAEDVSLCLNDFKLIKYEQSRFTIQQYNDLNAKAVDYIAFMVRQSTLPCVVVTHHAPSFKSMHPRYRHSSINCAFLNDLDETIEILEDLPLWVHGHVHDSHDYSIAGTRVVANPRGYPGENPGTYEVKVVEI